MAEWIIKSRSPGFSSIKPETSPFTTTLSHHGILGMKWGVRRYQNKDGTLTAAGRKRYYGDDNNYRNGWKWNGGNLTKAGEKAFKNRKGEWKNTPAAQEAKRHEENNRAMKDAETARTRKAVEYVENEYEKDISKMNMITKKEWEDIADLGLRTLAVTKSGIGDQIGLKDKYDNGDRSWFLYEDQTIGLGEVAAMINKGYSAEHVDKVLSKLDGASQYDVMADTKFGNALLFANSETGKDALSGFARQCENVKYLDSHGYKTEVVAPGKPYQWTEFSKDSPKDSKIKYKLQFSGDSLQYGNAQQAEKNAKKNLEALINDGAERFYKEYDNWLTDDNGVKPPKETIIKNLLKEAATVDLATSSIWLWSPDAQHSLCIECNFGDKKVRDISLQG